MNEDTRCDLEEDYYVQELPPMKYLSNIKIPSLLSPEDMNHLVGTVSKLQEVVLMLSHETFKFPQIVVIGDQSSGKSSVLEALVGRSFLPRGTGTVTRRPLYIRLEALSSANDRGEARKDRVVFHHVDKEFTNLHEVMTEVEEETERVAGNNKGICPEPIIMTLYSSKATANLTLVDLPGLTRVPLGDQPEDIENIVRELILSYVANPHSIILAVVPANTDIATSECLKIAREVDPDGERTLVVVTKLDIMDPGTNALDILTGNVISMKLGIIGVVNRSQRDIHEGKKLKQSEMEESLFFWKHYPQIAARHGRGYLTKRLQGLLLISVRKYLPQLRTKVQVQLARYSNQLKTLQGPEMKSPGESLLQMLTAFATCFTSQIRGQDTELNTCELKGGARISFVFHEVFGKTLSNINPLEGFSRASILTAVRNSAGAKPCIFVPENCFELLIKKQIVRLEAPALRCVQLVYDEMERILVDCCRNSSLCMIRFPKLVHKVQEISLNLLKSRIPETENLVKSIIAIHGAYINTAHPDFKSGESPFKIQDNQLVPLHESNAPQPVEASLIALIEKLIMKYFTIIRKEVQDMIPKAIMYSFVNHVLEHIHSELVSNLYGTGTHLQELMEESIAVVDRKKNISKMVEALERANKLITEIQESSFLET